MPKYDLNNYLLVTHRLSKEAKRDLFGIPFIEQNGFAFDKIGTDYTLVKYNNCYGKTKLLDYKIAHGFMFDDQLLSITKHPISFLKKMGRCKAWATPDFSIDINASEAHAIGLVEQSRWIGRLGQEYGHIVFPTVGWSRKELDDICFAGLRDGSIFFISTLGVNNEECRLNFLRGYRAMRNKFVHSKIVCLGTQIEGMDDDVAYIDYKESFGYEDFQ